MPTFADRVVSRGQSDWSQRPLILFSETESLLFIKVDPQLSSRISEMELLITANVPSTLIFALMMETIRSSERLFLQEPHGIASQKTAFFILTAVKPQIFQIQFNLKSKLQ
jgi:hypothetical protein